MEKFELLNDFIDGGLNDSEEKDLLQMLAGNDELRSELRQLLAVNRSLSQIRQGYNVPETSTNIIFSSIGFNNDAEFIKNPDSRKYKAAFVPVITSVLTCFLIFTTINLAGYKIISSDKKNNIITKDNNSKLQGNLAVKNENNLSNNTSRNYEKNIISDKMILNSKNNKTAKNIISNSVSSDAQKMFFPSAEESNKREIFASESNMPIIKNIYINSLSDKLNFNSGNYNIDQSLNSNNVPTEYNSDISRSIPISIEIRNSQYWNIPEATVTPSRFANFNNLSFDVKYNFENNFALGIDIRRESYFQKFNFYDVNNLYTEIEQLPNFTTASVSLSYALKTDHLLTPAFQVSLGVNEVGFVSRFLTGISYSISQNFDLILSAEVSNLTYEYQNNFFNSPKVGINYGLKYNF